jgi:hypothetical protein
MYYDEADLVGFEDELALLYWDVDLNQWVDATCGPYERHSDEDW